MLIWEGAYRGEAAETGERGGEAALGSGWRRLMGGRVTAWALAASSFCCCSAACRPSAGVMAVTSPSGDILTAPAPSDLPSYHAIEDTGDTTRSIWLLSFRTRHKAGESPSSEEMGAHGHAVMHQVLSASISITHGSAFARSLPNPQIAPVANPSTSSERVASRASTACFAGSCSDADRMSHT